MRSANIAPVQAQAVAADRDRLALFPALPGQAAQNTVPGPAFGRTLSDQVETPRRTPGSADGVETGQEEIAMWAGDVTIKDLQSPAKLEQKNYVKNAFDNTREFMLSKESTIIKCWFRHFDRNMNCRIDFQEFKAGMVSLRYPGDATSLEGLWCELDLEEFGEVSLEDVQADEAMLWNAFRRWGGSSFQSGRDFIRQLKRVYAQVAKSGSSRASEESVSLEEFMEGIRFLGWDGGSETLLYSALEPDGETSISSRELKWLEVEIRRFRQKEAAKKKALRVQEQKARSKQACQLALADFKAFLKRHYGPLFRAWRSALDNDGSMSVQRADLFKVCRSMNWRGDVRALWKALDHDGSGVSTLEELDPHCAQLLAHFKDWATSIFGPKPSSQLWHAFDRQRRRKLSYAQFVYECEAKGFRGKAKTLAVWLDWQDKKYLQEEDFHIFDGWKPPAWLSAMPNHQAAEDFRKHLLHKYGHLLKAWRSTMDKDNSNCCNWHEFQDAAKHVRHTGDIAGAWLAFDEDLSGFITLKEIDEHSYYSLVEFKRWADDEFGGVRSAFKVLDTDNSNELTFAEFRKACRNYGYPGDVKTLFDSLDQHGEMKLQLKEVSFLDDWEIRSEGHERSEGFGEDQQGRSVMEQEQAPMSKLIDYKTIVPGPGTYDVLPGFGAMPSMPTARHGGAFTFTCRRPLMKLANLIGPTNYEPKVNPTKSRKPAWSFGSSSASKGGIADIPKTAPGPGQYDTRPTMQGPKFSMRPRRNLTLHPAQKSVDLPRW